MEAAISCSLVHPNIGEGVYYQGCVLAWDMGEEMAVTEAAISSSLVHPNIGEVAARGRWAQRSNTPRWLRYNPPQHWTVYAGSLIAPSCRQAFTARAAVLLYAFGSAHAVTTPPALSICRLYLFSCLSTANPKYARCSAPSDHLHLLYPAIPRAPQRAHQAHSGEGTARTA